jgi:hypothetical protein
VLVTVVEGETDGVVMDEAGLDDCKVKDGNCETGLDDCKVKDGNSEAGLDDCKVKDGNRVLMRVLVRVVELVEMLVDWAKVVLGQATKASTLIASEYLIVDIGLGF